MSAADERAVENGLFGIRPQGLTLMGLKCRYNSCVARLRINSLSRDAQEQAQLFETWAEVYPKIHQQEFNRRL